MEAVKKLHKCSTLIWTFCACLHDLVPIREYAKRLGIEKTNMAEIMAGEPSVRRFEDVLSTPQGNSSCAFCCKEVSKYTCPRCHVRYCSSVCYKSDKHLQCSELFYKDCVMEAMCDQQSSREDKRKILELLQKLKKQDEEEGVQDTVDLKERLQNIDINNDTDAVWSALTDRERKEFESAVKSGEISGTIDVWIPWWTKVDDGNYR